MQHFFCTARFRTVKFLAVASLSIFAAACSKKQVAVAPAAAAARSGPGTGARSRRQTCAATIPATAGGTDAASAISRCRDAGPHR